MRSSVASTAVPIALHVVRKFAQEEQKTHAAHLFVGPIGLVEIGAQAGIHIGRTGRHDAEFQRRLLLQHQLGEALAVVEPRPGENVAQNRQHLAGLLGQRLAAQVEPRGRCRAARDRRAPALRPDAPGGAADPLRQAHEVLVADAGLDQRAAEQPHIGQQVARQGVQVEAEIEIHDAVGEQVMVEHRRIGQGRDRQRNELVLARQVGERQRRDGGKRLRRVGLFLLMLERRGGLHGGAHFAVGHGGARRVEPGLFLRRLALGLVAVGLEGDDGTVRVVDELMAQQRLEIALAGGDCGL